MTERPSEFERGHAVGRQDQSIADHGRRLDGINGSIEKSADALIALTNAVNLMRAEEKSRRERTDRRARNFALAISAVIALLAVVSFLRGSPF